MDEIDRKRWAARRNRPDPLRGEVFRVTIKKGELKMSSLRYYLAGVLTTAAIAPAAALVMDAINDLRASKAPVQPQERRAASAARAEDIWQEDDVRFSEEKGYVDEIGLPAYHFNLQLEKEVDMGGKRYAHVMKFCGPEVPSVGGAAIYRFHKNQYKSISFVMGHRDDSSSTEEGCLMAYLDGVCVLSIKIAPSDVPQIHMLPLGNARSVHLSMNNDAYCLAEVKFQ